MSTTLNQSQSDTLPSNIIWNAKNNYHCLLINTQSGKAIIDPSMPIVDMKKNDSIEVDATPKAESKKATDINGDAETDKGKGMVDEPIKRKIP